MASHFGIRNIRNTPMRMLNKPPFIVPFHRVVPHEKHIASICDSIDSDDQIVECYEFFSEDKTRSNPGTCAQTGKHETKHVSGKAPTRTLVDIKIMGVNIVISRDSIDGTDK